VTERRILHDCHLLGHLGQQLHSPVQHVVQIERAGEKGLDRPLLGRRQGLDRAKPVNEEPIPLVGGNSAGACVRLSDVPFFLQRCHVVAHRRW
jgi:hypothetical protein